MRARYRRLLESLRFTEGLAFKTLLRIHCRLFLVYLTIRGAADSAGRSGTCGVAESPIFLFLLEIYKLSRDGTNGAMKAQFLRERLCLAIVDMVLGRTKSNCENGLTDLLSLKLLKLWKR